jgi:aldehyde dehydrogenase (NAD+)
MVFQKTYKLYIDGKWVNSESGETFPSINPAKPKQVLGKFQKGNEDDVNKAVEAAERAFEEWNNTPAPEQHPSPKKRVDHP